MSLLRRWWFQIRISWRRRDESTGSQGSIEKLTDIEQRLESALLQMAMLSNRIERDVSDLNKSREELLAIAKSLQQLKP